MIDKSFIEKIEQMAETETLVVKGREYSTKQIYPVKDPEPVALVVHSLTGVVDYFRTNVDDLNLKKLVVHVEGPWGVAVYSAVEGAFKQRLKWLLACLESNAFRYGQYMPLENFIVALQSQFVQDEVTEQLLKVVGNITDGVVRTFEEDGVSQKVTAKAGIARVAEVGIPNPILLAPYRTFLEVKQPESRFVLRLRSGEGQPQAALFEGDGGEWKLDAVCRIRDYLRNELPEVVAILA